MSAGRGSQVTPPSAPEAAPVDDAGAAGGGPLPLEAPQPPLSPPFRWRPHILAALGCATVAPFTALAWPFALFTGFVAGRLLLRRERGRPPVGTDLAVTVLLLAVGGAGMFVFGIALGGIVALAITWMAAQSERRVWMGTPRQQLLARVLVVGLPALVWLLLLSGPAPAGA